MTVLHPPGPKARGEKWLDCTVEAVKLLSLFGPYRASTDVGTGYLPSRRWFPKRRNVVGRDLIMRSCDHGVLEGHAKKYSAFRIVSPGVSLGVCGAVTVL